MNEETLKKNIEWYKTTWGKNKTIPSQFEAPILFALSHYPELKEVKIRFHITGSAMFPYASRPVWQTMFRSRNEREYIVVIANNSLDPDMEKILLRKLIFNLQVGILGHELAHIVDYIKKSAAEIAAI